MQILSYRVSLGCTLEDIATVAAKAENKSVKTQCTDKKIITKRQLQQISLIALYTHQYPKNE